MSVRCLSLTSFELKSVLVLTTTVQIESIKPICFYAVRSGYRVWIDGLWHS